MNFERILEEFNKILKIPSITGNELDVIKFLENILDEYNISHKRVCLDENRPNLIAKIKGENPNLPPVILISHIDVVDGVEENWTYPMFSAENVDDRIFARGTLDTKHLTMMQLYAMLQIDFVPKQDIYFLATSDEEAGSKFGMEYVKKACPELFKNAIVINEGGGFPLLINNQEYIMMTIGEKSLSQIEITPKSTANKSDAILTLSSALKEIFSDTEIIKKGNLQTHNFMKQILKKDTLDNSLGQELYRYSSSGSVNMKNFSIDFNDDMKAIIEFKLLPDFSIEELLEYLSNKLQSIDVNINVLSDEIGFVVDIDKNKYIFDDIESICKSEGVNYKILPMLALGRTDGRFFGSSGADVLGISPTKMEDSFDIILPKVHGDNESISIASFKFGCEVILKMLMNLTKKEFD